MIYLHGGFPSRKRHSGTPSLFHQLVKGLAFLDHAEVFPRMFLDGVQSLLQVPHLGLQGGIALAQLQVLRALRLDLAVQFPDFLEAAVTEPQAVGRSRPGESPAR